MKALILATAGHIDHGKTALVRALTGVDTDRLPEEKQRGITIDLGFAPLRLGDLSFGVVDVPGHEGFIRNMLAGATGMDAVLLVIAADEGVMPQTREHLAILDLLAVQCGVVAITKCDLVDQEWLELVIDDVRRLLVGTTLRDAPIVPVSAKSGAGLERLRAAITQQATRPNGRRADDLLRMPIDRVFTVRGTGTVVTGTIWSGTARVEQTITVRPAGERARVRGIQVHGQAVGSARAGERAAFALAGLEKNSIVRGDVVLDSNVWSETHMLLVQLRIIDDTTWLLKQRQRVRIHVGTAEVIARVALFEASMVRPGDSAWAQLRLEQPVVARVGDRFVLRSYSPITTIGGGTIVELSAGKRSRLTSGQADEFASVAAGAPAQACSAALALRDTTGATLEELAVITPHAYAEINSAVETLGADVARIGPRFYARNVVERVEQSVLRHVNELHEADPLRPALERAEVRSGMRKVPAELIDHALELAVQHGSLIASGGQVAAKGFQPVLSDRQATLKTALLDALKRGGLAPPTIAELGQSLGDTREVQRLLRVLEHEGMARPVSQDLYIEVSALTAAQERTRAVLGGVEGLTAAEFRTALPVTRKHLIPLLEYFDRTGITVRHGDLRMVVPASEEG